MFLLYRITHWDTTMALSTLEIISVFGTFAAIVYYINNRLIKLPPAVGITLTGLLMVILFKFSVITFSDVVKFTEFEKIIMSFDFKTVLLDILICFLLFASAINFEIVNLKKWWKQITLLATVSVIISTAIIGGLLYGLINTVFPNIHVPFWYCMLFGSFMSPTDPIAAVAVFKNLNANRGDAPNKSKHIEIKLLGESLFNDGTGIWLFTAISSVLIGIEQSAFSLSISLVREIFGAIVLGLFLGIIGKLFIRHNDVIGIIISTLSISALTYTIASRLHVSAPIAVVIVGLIVGHNIRKLLNESKEHQIKEFWEYCDEIINVVLFSLMSLIALFIKWDIELIALGVLTFPILIIARWVSIKLTFLYLQYTGKAQSSSINIVSWGGIRGSISLALAIGLLNNTHGNILIGITFVCVILSNTLQGMTLKHIINAYYPPEKAIYANKLDYYVQFMFNLLITQKVSIIDSNADNQRVIEDTVSDEENIVETMLENTLGIDSSNMEKDIENADNSF